MGGHNVYRVVDGGYSIGPKQRSDGDCRWASQDDVYVCGSHGRGITLHRLSIGDSTLP